MTGGNGEHMDVLARAGLERVEDQRITGDVVAPHAAWRPVVAWDAEPTVAVPGDRQDVVAQVNAQWYRLAVDHGVLGDDGEFLIEVANHGTGGAPRRWTRVRLNAEWDLAGVLGDRPGRPEFVTLSTDGDALLGATTEECDVWLIAQDRVGERREAAAAAAARESAEEREAAWERRFHMLRPTAGLRGMWANGLARRGTAVPDDIRHRLLGRTHHLLWHELPEHTVDAAVAHPEWRVRGLLAEAQPNLTAGQWTRLILGTEDERQRWILTGVAADRRAELLTTAYEQLGADASARVREEAARLPELPAGVVAALSHDSEAQVRATLCRSAWSSLDAAARRRLRADADRAVRSAALLQHHREHPLSQEDFSSGDLPDNALATCRLTDGLARHVARDGAPARRSSLAKNPHLSPDLVRELARDPDDSVRWVVSVRPDLTEEERAQVPVETGPGLTHALDWVVALHDDPDALRRLAESSHPLVRRSVARARRLPPDVVARLARDEDPVVHLFLAESCDDAPAELLMRVWQWWTGSFSYPDRPHSHPNFPRTGLLRYADSPSPRMRRLALDDPESTVELVERFSRDPEEEVRLRAATDPRLTAASAVRLLDDVEETVRRAALTHPRLPAGVLVSMLFGGDTAEDAARNPALPIDVMRWMTES
ncbi:PE-PGRS family protein [Streptomyces sp. NPDC001922]|uniref:PE-PGRS family protein n=1 Tax=Streptomyces sp. NPDC001922 TaxID=3364624 RepID=UPI00369EA45F